MSDKSTCDRFIEVMGMLNAINPDIDEPARHMMRRNRRLAESILDNALRQASELAFAAQDMPEEAKRIAKAAQEACAVPTTPLPGA